MPWAGTMAITLHLSFLDLSAQNSPNSFNYLCVGIPAETVGSRSTVMAAPLCNAVRGGKGKHFNQEESASSVWPSVFPRDPPNTDPALWGTHLHAEVVRHAMKTGVSMPGYVSPLTRVGEAGVHGQSLGIHRRTMGAGRSMHLPEKEWSQFRVRVKPFYERTATLGSHFR